MTPLTISEQVERIARIIDPHPFDAGFAPERGAVQNDIDKAADEAREKARAILALASPPEPTAGGGLGYKEHAVGMQTILKCVVSTGDAEALRACHLVFDAFKAADDERVALRAAEPTAGGGVESLRRLSEKATPGEWHVDPKAPEESYFEDVNIIRPDGLAVAVAVQNADIVPPQPEANASFIVACVNYVRDMLASQDHAPSAGAVQDPAWKLVPVEPTEAMLEPCGWSGVNPAKPHPLSAHTKPKERGEPYLLAKAYWRAMLAASPPPPEGELP